MIRHTSSKSKIEEFQTALGDTVVLLLELKTRPGLTLSESRSIDEAVRDMQEIIRSIPSISESRRAFNVVFEAITKAHVIWRKLLGKDG